MHEFGLIAALKADVDETQKLIIFFSETQPPLSQIANLGAPRKKKKRMTFVSNLFQVCII